MLVLLQQNEDTRRLDLESVELVRAHFDVLQEAHEDVLQARSIHSKVTRLFLEIAVFTRDADDRDGGHAPRSIRRELCRQPRRGLDLEARQR